MSTPSCCFHDGGRYTRRGCRGTSCRLLPVLCVNLGLWATKVWDRDDIVTKKHCCEKRWTGVPCRSGRTACPQCTGPLSWEHNEFFDRLTIDFCRIWKDLDASQRCACRCPWPWRSWLVAWMLRVCALSMHMSRHKRGAWMLHVSALSMHMLT